MVGCGGLRSWALSRLRHFQTVYLVVAGGSAKTHAGSITRLNGRRYLWCHCHSAMTSNKHWCLRSEYPPNNDLARKSAERRRSMWSTGMGQVRNKEKISVDLTQQNSTKWIDLGWTGSRPFSAACIFIILFRLEIHSFLCNFWIEFGMNSRKKPMNPSNAVSIQVSSFANKWYIPANGCHF